jgi:hypothetical protein
MKAVRTVLRVSRLATGRAKDEEQARNLLASFLEKLWMDALNSAGLGARRNEDIALDLLKFVAATAGVGRPAAPSTGFSGAAAPKPEEHVTELLSLYSRCLKAVEGKEAEL